MQFIGAEVSNSFKKELQKINSKFRRIINFSRCLKNRKILILKILSIMEYLKKSLIYSLLFIG